MVEFSCNNKVEELVKVLVDVTPVVPNLPPFNTIFEAKVALAEGFNLSSPLVMVVLPVYVLAEFSRMSAAVERVLLTIIPPVPEIIPERVSPLPDAAVLVKVRLPFRVMLEEIVGLEVL